MIEGLRLIKKGDSKMYLWTGRTGIEMEAFNINKVMQIGAKHLNFAYMVIASEKAATVEERT